MEKRIELLAPGGDIESIKAAIIAGADAIYCGLNNFNARNRAVNISFEDLVGILRIAHKNNCKVFLTLNIIILEQEIKTLISLLNKLVNTSIDGIIVQDIGLFYILSKHFKSLDVHTSTQFTTHNKGQILFLNKIKTSRVNLSRELNLNEIKDLTSISHKNNISTEVFVHGSNCISFSGACYMSSVASGNSGNRGRCSQPCRDQYETTSQGVNFPLNIKDNSAYSDLKELYSIGVNSIKVEGRIKKPHYVYTVINTWRKQLDNFYQKKSLLKDNSDLYKVFNRDFTNAFLKGNISKDIFIDNPRDNSAEHFLKLNKETQSGDLEKFKTKLYDEKTKVINEVETKIQNLTIEKRNLDIKIHGKVDDYLKLELESPFKLLKLKSKSKLKKSTKDILNQATLIKRFKNLETSEFHINKFETKNLTKKLFIPLKELDLIKKEIVFQLNGQKYIPAIELPKLKLNKFQPKKAKLSILISSKEDLNLLSKINDLDIFFKIPDNLEDKYEDYIKLFKENKNLIPWFPTIIIGKDYDLAVNFLHNINPSLIITNNTGIAYEAYKAKIPWIAGPYINVVNSYSLISLKENFNCKGSFISNELNRLEIKQIKNYKNLDLYYSIYHPILLMTTRMCLFHQVTGCEKNIMNNTCIKNCEKSSTITNLNGTKYFIEKTLGDNHRIFNSKNFLNLDIIEDLPNIFSNFLIDLTNIQTDTNSKIDKYSLIKLFQNSINSDIESINIIKKALSKTTNQQYKKGL